MTPMLPIAEPTEDLTSLSIDLAPFEPEQIAQAQQLSQIPAREAQRWQIYLNALGLFGFEQWLIDRSALTVDWRSCSLCQPGYAALLPAAAQVRVGAFQICLIAVEGNPEQIELPRAVVELPEWMAHFYVVMEVWEELPMTRPWGFLRHDQLVALQQQEALTIHSDWTVTLSPAEFEQEADRLLLHLRCLDPAALPLPTVSQAVSQAVSQSNQPISADLMPQLVNWQPTQTPLWQILDWQQGSHLLRCPELVNWLVRPRSAQWQTQLALLFQFLTQPAINVGRWLNQELDQIAEQFNWVLLPPLVPAQFRSAAQTANRILAQLDRLQVAIPPTAHSAYQDFNLGDLKLRLYAVTWPQTAEDGTPEWSLVVVLTAQAEQQLPLGLQLQVRDITQLLAERELTEFMPEAHLYVHVIGNWHEKFLVTIAHRDLSLSLPPFAFHPVE